MKLISWNMAGRTASWQHLVGLDAEVALLQEARQPPADVAAQLTVNASPWMTGGGGTRRAWRTAVVGLYGSADLKWIEAKPLSEAAHGDLAVSRPGTLAAATITAPSGNEITVVSAYAAWEKPHRSTSSSWIYADASAHRVISDLSCLIGTEKRHRIIVAGDFNILNGYGEGGSPYWGGRYQTVFARMEALGLSFVGPQAPFGRQAEPWPDELPRPSRDVPTFYHQRQTPDTATRQLDFVFASASLRDRLQVVARNDPNEWGPSDHCVVEVNLAD